MKNTIKLIGTQRLRLCAIALIAVIAFSFAACSNGTTSGAEGTFTLTGIPAEYNGKYVIFCLFAYSGEIWGSQGWAENGDIILSQISNGKAVIPLHVGSTDFMYAGNETFDSSSADIFVKIYEPATIYNLDVPGLLTGGFQSVTFSNGSATKSWNDLLIWE